MENLDPSWIAAAMQFKAKYTPAVCKKRGYANWKVALQNAWFDGWDEKEPDSHHLRRLRNNGGLEWLKDQSI